MGTGRPSARRIWTIRAALLLYGILFAFIGVRHLDATLPADPGLMGTREEGISRSIAVLDRGGPPLLGSDKPYGTRGISPQRDYHPVGVSDDQGAYFYLPVLGRLIGERDPGVLMRIWYIASWAVLLLVFPLVFYAISGALLPALISPYVALSAFDYTRNTDLYWVSAWAMLLCLPLLVALTRLRWGGWAFAGLAGVTLIGSYASSWRINTGLPVLVGALILLVMRERRWKFLIPAALVLIACSQAVHRFAFDGIRIYRDEVAGIALREGNPTVHPFWHNIYIGLGYLPNRYGIRYSDEVAYDATQIANPGVRYLSGEYEDTLRTLVIDVVKDDPGFVASLTWTKLGIVLDEALSRYWTALVGLPLMLLVATRRRRYRADVLVVLPAPMITILPPILTIPIPQYSLGFMGSTAVLWLLVWAWALGLLERAGVRAATSIRNGRGLAAAFDVAIRRPLHSAARRTAGLTRRTTIATVACVAVLATIVGTALARVDEARATLFYYNGATALEPTSDIHGKIVRGWGSREIAPPAFNLFGTTVERTAGRVDVRTSPDLGYQIATPRFVLPPGRYQAVSAMTIDEGGASLGVLDARANSWLAFSSYWDGQRFGPGRRMVTRFSLGTATPVHVILSNWGPQPVRSRWSVSRISILTDSGSRKPVPERPGLVLP